MALMGAVLLLTACGDAIVQVDGTDVDETGVVQGAGKTDQGKTDQGKTDQGKTDQGSTGTGLGSVLIVNRGSWNVRSVNSPFTYTHTGGDLRLVGGRPGSELLGVPTVTYTTDQDGAVHVDPLTFTRFTAGPALVKFYVQELSSTGSISAIREARITNTSVDTGPYNNPAIGYFDSANMLVPTYRNSINGNTQAPNSDIRFYKVQLKNKTDPNRWDDLCQSSGPGNKAIFMPGYFDTSGRYVRDAQYMGITCWDGTAAKCMRWGYRPWRSLFHSTAGTIQLEPLWLSCVRAAKADYCGNGVSFTETGRQIDLWDRYGFIAKSPENDLWLDSNGRAEAFSDESAFDTQGAVCLVRERLYSYNFTAASCPMITTYVSGGEFCVQPPIGGTGTWSQCGPKGIVSSPTNVFDRGTISTCDQVAQRPPLIYVSSYDSGCSTHYPTENGQALAMDCNCLTKSICTLPGAPTGGHPWRECCAEDSNGHLIQNKWDNQCVNKARALLSSPVFICPQAVSLSP